MADDISNPTPQPVPGKGGGGVAGTSMSPLTGQPGIAPPSAGLLAYGLEPFADPNSMPFFLIVAANGANQGFAAARVVVGSWGGTVYGVYPSMDGVLPILSTMLATLTATDQAVTFPLTSPFFIVKLIALHGALGNYHRVEGSAMTV